MTRRTVRTQWGLATEKPPRTRELDYSRARGKVCPHFTVEWH
jgi:hypothetical protein